MDFEISYTLVPKETHVRKLVGTCPGLLNKSYYSKTNNHLFTLQNSRLILIKVMVELLVKVLILMRVMCGIGTREYLLITQLKYWNYVTKCLG